VELAFSFPETREAVPSGGIIEVKELLGRTINFSRPQEAWLFIVLGQQALVGRRSGIRLSFAGRQLLEIPVMGNIPFINRGPAGLLVIQAKIELGVGTVFGSGSRDSFGGAGGRREKKGQGQDGKYQ
jgi:hypothetical protein